MKKKKLTYGPNEVSHFVWARFHIAATQTNNGGLCWLMLANKDPTRRRRTVAEARDAMCLGLQV